MDIFGLFSSMWIIIGGFASFLQVRYEDIKYIDNNGE